MAGNRIVNKTVKEVNRLGLPRGTVPSLSSVVKQYERGRTNARGSRERAVSSRSSQELL